MKQRGNTLVGLLAAMAIIAILSVGLFYGGGMLKGGPAESPRKDGKGKTVPGLAQLAAKDIQCRNNLSQVRAGIQVAVSASGDDQFPATIEDTRLGNSFYRCPVGKEPYNYDATNGQVACPHPGHEKY